MHACTFTARSNCEASVRPDLLEDFRKRRSEAAGRLRGLLRLVWCERGCGPGRCFLTSYAQAGRFGGAEVTKVTQNLDFLPGILAREPRERIGDDVAVVQVLYGWIAAHVQPQTMHQLNIIRAQRRRVRANVEHLGLSAGADDKEVELSLRLGQCFPGLSEMEGLVLGGHGTG